MCNPEQPPLYLALDTASPTVTIAIGADVDVDVDVRVAHLPIAKSSVELLGAIDSLFLEAGRSVHDLAGLLCTAGPGSFTGIRVGMATVMGLGESLDIPTVALPSLWVQAHWAAKNLQKEGAHEHVTSVLAAHRKQCFLQTFRLGNKPRPEGPIILTERPVEDLASSESPVVSADSNVRGLSWPVSKLVLDPGALAGHLIAMATTNPPQRSSAAPLDSPRTQPLFRWDAQSLARPLYAQTPAVATRPKVSPGSRPSKHSKTAEAPCNRA